MGNCNFKSNSTFGVLRLIPTEWNIEPGGPFERALGMSGEALYDKVVATHK